MRAIDWAFEKESMPVPAVERREALFKNDRLGSRHRPVIVEQDLALRLRGRPTGIGLEACEQDATNRRNLWLNP